MRDFAEKYSHYFTG